MDVPPQPQSENCGTFDDLSSQLDRGCYREGGHQVGQGESAEGFKTWSGPWGFKG